METNLFLNVDGQTSENLTTEILKFILNSKKYSDYQKNFYNFIFDRIECPDTQDFLFSVDTQCSFEDYSRPDCIIENSETVIFIENKFYAQFSNSDQIFRYCKILDEDKTFKSKNKYLILLTLKARGNYYESEIKKQFKEKPEDLKEFFKRRNIIYKLIFWENILKFSHPDDLIITNLGEYIIEKFQKVTILTKEELEMVNSSKIPEVINKLQNGIDNIKNELLTKNIRVDRTGQSREFYGYFIYVTFGKLWFGYYLTAWRKFKTPYVIQIKEEWISEHKESKKIMHLLSRSGFAEHQGSLFFPIAIDEADIMGKTLPILIQKLEELKCL